MSQFIEMFNKVSETKSLCEICRPKQWPTIPTKDFTEDGYFVYGANGIIGHYSEYNHETPTILMACRGASCGAINISKPYSYITGNAMCMDEIIPEVSFEYLSYFLSNYNYKTIITGGAQPQITYTNLKKVMVPIPPYEEQLKFALIYKQADKSEFIGCKSQFIEMFYNGNYTVDKLRKHIDVIRGVSYKPSDVYETHNENTTIVLRSNNIEGGKINFDDLVYVSTERVSELQLLSAGDIVMCGSNGSKKLVGKAAMLQETPTIRTSFGAFCLGIRCKPTLVPEYLATYFQTSLYRDEIEQLGSGSNILNIKPDHIYDLQLPIPLYGEQMAFVSIVNQADKSEYYN